LRTPAIEGTVREKRFPKSLIRREKAFVKECYPKE
jgi:hypothetical protein